MKPLILASGSPRRAQLLTQFGMPFESCPAPVEEPHPDPHEDPGDHAVRCAISKVMSVVPMYSDGRVILGADTIVTLDNLILGKPVSDDDARRMLKQLANRQHCVITGIALRAPKINTPVTARVSTLVRFRDLTRDEIEWYIATGECRDKAGAYGIQGAGGALIHEITGCYYNVVGLPVPCLISLLQTYIPGFWPPPNSQVLNIL